MAMLTQASKLVATDVDKPQSPTIKSDLKITSASPASSPSVAQPGGVLGQKTLDTTKYPATSTSSSKTKANNPLTPQQKKELMDNYLEKTFGSGGYGGYGGGSSEVEPQKKDWNGSISSDPDAINKLLNTEQWAQANKDLMAGAGIDGDVNIGRINHIDTVQEEAMLKQITDAQKEQAELQTQNTVNNGIKELQRNMEDTQEQFQTQRDQINADEQRALDNQVLYSEARGDRGGIGQAQYGTIQNNAATNRLTVQRQQTKLASDTARQIADLRAQGEFEKANQLLSITQNYLSQLMDIYTWAKETNLGVDEFNSQIEQWEENYKLNLLGAEIDVANATGAFSNGTPTYSAWMKAQQDLAASGQALMQAGVAPTAQQLEAMGMTQAQAIAYLSKYFPYG